MKTERTLPLNALRVFRAAAEEGSFKAAATRLFVTQAAVSQQIRTLEQYLAQPLFVRNNREVVLNSAGQQLLGYVQQGLDTLEQGVHGLLDDPLPNTLRISSLPSFSARWLVPKLGRFQQLQPELTVQLSPTTALARFGDGQTDLAVRFGYGDYEGLESRFLAEDYLIPICSPLLFDPREDPLAQLHKLPMLYDDGQELPEVYQQFQRALGIDRSRTPSSPLLLNNASMLVEAVLAGQGYGLLRFSLIHELLARGLLVCPLNSYLKSPLSYYLVAPARHFQRPKVQTFQQWISREIQETDKAWRLFHKEVLNSQPPITFEESG